MDSERPDRPSNQSLPAEPPNEYIGIFLGYWFAENDDLPNTFEQAALAASGVYRRSEFQNETNELLRSLNYILTQGGEDLRGWLSTIEHDFELDEAKHIIDSLFTGLLRLQGNGPFLEDNDELTSERIHVWRARRKLRGL